ncbi:unnamed protein product [Absidia cylindrospora]
MLREKSSNTSLTTWLKQHSQTQPDTHNNENIMTEDEQLQQALKQSREDYRAQQKLQYDLLSKSTPSTSASKPPPIEDDDDQWFQTISPRRVKREKKLSLKRDTSKRKRSNTNDTQTQSTTTKNKTNTTQEQQQKQQQQQKHSSIRSPIEALAVVEKSEVSEPRRHIKGEHASWEICDDMELKQEVDNDWEIEGSQSLEAKEEDQWQIDDTDQRDDVSISNNTPTRQSTNVTSSKATTDVTGQDDNLTQYVSAIRNRNTKKPMLLSSPTPATCHAKRPATQLDDIFKVFRTGKKTQRPQKVNHVNAATDSSYHTPSVYQTSFDQHGTLTTDAVDVEHHHPISTHSNNKSPDHSAAIVDGRTPGVSSSVISLDLSEQRQQQKHQDSDPWDNVSDCSSIIDLCMEGGGGEKGKGLDDIGADAELYNNNGLDSFYDDIGTDAELYNNNNDLSSIIYSDMNDWPIAPNDDDAAFIDNSRVGSSTTERNNTIGESSINNINDAYEIEDDDQQCLSPLEGFKSLLEQSHTSAENRPYFEQLTGSSHPPSSRVRKGSGKNSNRKGKSTSRWRGRGRGRSRYGGWHKK